ncbi:nectin-3-like isoform X1 [Neoarius graeffei]|uniref:nectin-3-like isoform X1 n=1 Tax=Neoarius graeffei TaxID=443677 RepID=UPI00298CC637|nr:nectin-3-like isoform X1 [Neoarius graeffei]XP_060786388.1 nectin-3-like isoform X1 [Neoarius graeffei]XP_060786389.1 nectin-3-like isoform X1 [Neoarius graeffei]
MHFGKRFTLVSFIFSLFSLCSRITAIKIIGRNANVTAGDDAHLFCQLIDTMEDLTSITWQRRTKEKPTDTDFLIINSDGKVEYSGFGNRVEFTGNILKHNGSILLKNVTSSDEGIYTCILSIYPSGPFEREIHLAVLVLPVVSVGPDVPPVAGDAEQILATCTAADAKPEAEVSWSLEALSDSVKIQTDVTVDSEERYTVKSSLIGVASKDLNEQNVQCLVSHPGLQEKLELNCTLIIHYPPQVVYITSVGDQGETREFQCDADANPKPTNFTWSRYFPVTDPLSSGVNSRQVIPLTPNNNGLYYCVVSNQYGSAVGSLYMHVFPESRTCWTLFIIFIVFVLAVVGVFAFRKSNFCQGFLQFIERLRNRQHDPVNQ